jgi:mono/diheme cytochrome c family protein
MFRQAVHCGLSSYSKTDMKKMPSSGLVGVATLMLAATSESIVTGAGAEPAEKGKSVYSDYCATCHGEELRNTSGGVTFDLRKLRPDEHERFVNSVLNGKNQMPPWRSVLESDQIEAIWAYIRAIIDQ